jgi:phosphoglycolate phosphatase-like HAD superfamily hydrolase
MDIEAGKEFSARTIAVATGLSSIEDLKSHHPDFVFPNLLDTQAILNAIISD